jgi:hypothetical protein
MGSSIPPLGILLGLAACSIGPKVEGYQPAQGPAGAEVTIALTDDRTVGGELLAVEDTTFLLVSGRELVRIGMGGVRTLKAPRFSASRQLLVTAPARERLQRISRYPQGVSPELEARLLEAYGLSDVRRMP